MRFYLLITLSIAGLIMSCGDATTESGNDNQLVSSVPDTEIKIDSLDKKRSSRIDHFFTRINKIGRFNGVVLFADGNKVFEKAYGYSNFRQKKRLTVNTSFQLASVSKPVTGIAILMLKDRGELKLTDSVHNILPEFPYRGITVEQLLSHRSGLGNYVYWSENYWKETYSLMNNDDVLEMMAEYKPKVYYTPNRRYNYNNTNFELLATIVERVSGKKFSEFLRDNILSPLKMKDTFVYTKEDFERRDVATGYKNKYRPYSPFFLDGVYGDKGLYSTVGDLYKLDQALRNNKLISDSTKTDAYTNRSKSFRKPYGLGWRMTDYNDKHIIYHHGWWRGFRSYFIRSIDDEKTIIVLTNTINGSKLNNNMLLDLLK